MDRTLNNDIFILPPEIRINQQRDILTQTYITETKKYLNTIFFLCQRIILLKQKNFIY